MKEHNQDQWIFLSTDQDQVKKTLISFICLVLDPPLINHYISEEENNEENQDQDQLLTLQSGKKNKTKI